MDKVVILARVSTDHQEYQRQINELTAYCENVGWSVEEIFANKVSGAKRIEERKEILSLVEYVREHQIKRVVCLEISRVGRNTLEALKVIQYLTENGVSLFVKNYNLETLDANGKPNPITSLICTILLEIASMERLTIKERMESGRKQYIERCRKEGIKMGRPSTYRKSVETYKEQANGIIPGISRPVLLELNLPIPPFTEQKRIVNEVRIYSDYLKSVSDNIDSLKASILKIKSTILDLAMQGKLVEQDLSDEPAAEMLRRINPKAKIITDNPHYPQLPDNWVLIKTKDAFEINPKNKAQDDTISGFVPMASIMDGFNNSFTFENRNWGQIKSGFTHFADGDVAVAKISPCLENRKSMILNGLPNGIGAGTTELLVFRSKLLLPEFSLMFFKSNYFINCCIGTFNGVVGQQRVGKNIVEDIIIPIPPMNIQRQIIDQVEYWFSLLDDVLNSIEYPQSRQ